MEGFRRWKGSILVPDRNTDLQGSCSIRKRRGITNRSEQNSCKLLRTVCDVISHRSAFKGPFLLTCLEGVRRQRVNDITTEKTPRPTATNNISEYEAGGGGVAASNTWYRVAS